MSDVQDEEQDEKQQPHSASGSDIRPADDEDILAEDPDTTNAATQRLLRGEPCVNELPAVSFALTLLHQVECLSVFLLHELSP